MNTRRVKARFKTFRILLDNECTSTIVMWRLVKTLGLEEVAQMQWNTQARNITTNIMVKIDFTLPTLSATNVRMWNCHVDESSKVRYDIILG